MARREGVDLSRFRMRGFLLAVIVCIALIGAGGAIEISAIQRPAGQLYEKIVPTPTIYPCAAGYSCMLPATATEKGYTISSDNRPCAYIQDSGQLTAEYCYRPPLSSAAIAVAKKVYSGESLGSGSSGGAVETFGPGPGAGIAAVVAARPLTGLCTADGQTYCPGWGCVDLRTNITNCGSCGSSCINFTGCRDGKCYTDLSMAGDLSKVAILSKVAAVEGGQADQYSGMEHKALNPQPVPPLAPVRAVSGTGTVNRFFSPIFSFFAPAGESVPATPAPVVAVARNRGILESILAIFSPGKNMVVINCADERDCPSHSWCDQNVCEKESIVSTFSSSTVKWGDPVRIWGSELTNSPSSVCITIAGPGLPDTGWVIADGIQPRTEAGYGWSYTWDTSRPLSPGFTKQTGTYLVRPHLGSCTSDMYNNLQFTMEAADTTSMSWIINVTTSPVP